MVSFKILQNLEYDKILSYLKKFVVLSSSLDKIDLIRPETTLDDALSLQGLTFEGERVLYHYNRSPLEKFDDVSEVLMQAKVLSTLSFASVKRVGTILRASRIFLNSVNDIPKEEIPQISQLLLRLYFNKLLEEDISNTFISDEEIADNASSELYTIRKKIRKINGDIKDRLNALIRNKEVQKHLQDTIITSREGRFVVPVKAESKGKVNGLVHDYSSTGATIYVEPIEIVEINNELRILYLEEKAEIERIMQDFTRRICNIADALEITQETLIDLDIVLAKVKYGKSLKGVLPEIKKDGSYNIIGGRHPLIDKNVVVPVSVALPFDKNYILISGPNTGGKTVTLKMVGLFALLAISGMYIPAKEGSSISFYDNVFSDIGDEQSIEQNLSTFSSHIKTIKEIIENVDDNSLVLLDEIGGGTDPEEGSALALAVFEFLLDKNSRGIITTHYSELKEFSYSNDKILNASMEFDMGSLSPTYKLNVGVPGTSKALEIAGRLGISKEIIESARAKISPLKKSFDEIIQSCESERIEAEKLKNEYALLTQELSLELENVKKEKEKLIKERENNTRLAKIEAKRIIANATEEAEELVDKIKEIFNNPDGIDGKDVIEASKLKNKIANSLEEEDVFDEEDKYLPFNEKLAKVGDKVFVKSLNSICAVSEIKKNEIFVNLGTMSFKAKKADLLSLSPGYLKYHEKSNEVKEKLIKRQSSSSIKIKNNVKSEINIMGKRVPDAKAEVEAFLDSAYACGLNELKIIHGVGTLALKKAVEEVLRSSSLVKSFRGGQYGEGDLGVSIVELKK